MQAGFPHCAGKAVPHVWSNCDNMLPCSCPSRQKKQSPHPDRNINPFFKSVSATLGCAPAPGPTTGAGEFTALTGWSPASRTGHWEVRLACQECLDELGSRSGVRGGVPLSPGPMAVSEQEGRCPVRDTERNMWMLAGHPTASSVTTPMEFV